MIIYAKMDTVGKKNTRKYREHIYLCPKCRRVWAVCIEPPKFEYYHDFPKYGKTKKTCPECEKCKSK